MANFGSSNLKDLVEAAIAEKEASKGKEFDETAKNEAISRAERLESGIDRLFEDMMDRAKEGLKDISRSIDHEMDNKIDKILDSIKENLLKG
ncbi:MAG: hypothetical protein HGB08_03810 [Candidatus Moranbacteria bacterium]|nr:hypothetical protein [Candidatus Moranbacteria bacterium]